MFEFLVGVWSRREKCIFRVILGLESESDVYFARFFCIFGDFQNCSLPMDRGSPKGHIGDKFRPVRPENFEKL